MFLTCFKWVGNTICLLIQKPARECGGVITWQGNLMVTSWVVGSNPDYIPFWNFQYHCASWRRLLVIAVGWRHNSAHEFIIDNNFRDHICFVNILSGPGEHISTRNWYSENAVKYVVTITNVGHYLIKDDGLMVTESVWFWDKLCVESYMGTWISNLSSLTCK